MLINLALANDASEYEKSVAEIGKQIEEVSRNLNANKTLLKTQQDELLEIEQEISILGKQLQSTEQKISEQKRQGDQLFDQIEVARKTQKDDLQALSRLLVSRYTDGKTNYIKMLLNQENPYAVGRLNNYYEYFAEARQEKIIKLREKLSQLKSLEEQHNVVLAELEQTQIEQKNQQQSLDKSKLARQENVNSLNAKVATSSEQLDKLKQDRSRLNALLKEIALQAERLKKLEEQRLSLIHI